MSKPRTEAQKLASRINGQKSRGPKTAEGKAIAARNAIKHGLNSASVVLHCERRERYNQYLEDLTAEWEPETITELELVTALADAQWQLKRLTAIRTALFDLEMDRAEQSFRENFPGSDETTRLALAWQALSVDARSLGELNRHEAHLRRVANNSISKLLAIGEARTQNEQKQQEIENEPDIWQQQSPVQLQVVTAVADEERPATEPVPTASQQKCENEPEQQQPALETRSQRQDNQNCENEPEEPVSRAIWIAKRIREAALAEISNSDHDQKPGDLPWQQQKPWAA